MSENLIHLNPKFKKISGFKKYDFFINPDTIIEVHGKQHYEDVGFENLGGRKLEEEMENDSLKKYVAMNNGIKNYIVIDCRKSELEWIRENILSGYMKEIYDLSNINWLKCEEFALSNLVKLACKFKKENPELTAVEIGKLMNMHSETIRRYLRQGSKLGWCNYDYKEENKNHMNKLHQSQCKKILVIKDNIELGIFNSGVELEKLSYNLFNIKFTKGGISAAIKNSRKYKGYTLKYV